MYTRRPTVEHAIQGLAQLLPDGLVFGRLQAHHAETVASHWPRLHGWPNKEPYFRELITIHHCPAIYSTDNLDQPVSYTVVLPCYQNFSWTDKKYRNKKLFYLTNMMHSIVMVMNRLLTCEIETHIVSLILKDGDLIPAGYYVKDLIITDIFSSKL